MSKKSASTIKDALLGLIVTMVSDLNMSKDDILKAISFTDESPFI
jgi:BarA-like signal transduction histidine kinase